MVQNVLFITTGLRKGGAETQLIKIARFLKNREYRVSIVSLKPINDFNIDFKAEGLEPVFLKNWLTNPFSNCLMLYRTVRAFNPDVVIAFMFISIIFARFLKMWFRFKLISSIRTPVIANKWYGLFKITADWDDVVVYNSFKSKSNFEKNNLVKKTGLVLNNAISIPDLSAIKNTGVQHPFVWISMAHFVPEKDYMTLFKAIALIKEENFRIDILGNLFDQEWPFQVIKELQITDHVNLLGLKTDTTGYLKEADGFVLSSFLEGMPNALLEAMAYHKPVIASAVDGIEELLENIDCGFLFQQGDEKELAEKMLQVMNMTAAERDALGQNGRKHIEKHFSEDKVLQDWLSLVEQFADHKKVSLSAS
ncbi:glycosyltransferase [Pedobacter gandavensis]|uniref:Glycosyltransferase n=1 Tax=Pedobacter gandavensis TaxID=2679963 RepID=A0ABR6EVI9_9SPHI|nr:glycosyltransferase [Pedobacter gandavensis]MBB2148468.1 glycosyltransferase [Pedobacter gandavensis]